MPSHAYFYATSDNPFRETEVEDPVDTPEERAVRERILDALDSKYGTAGDHHHAPEGYSIAHVGDLELMVCSRWVHVRLPWLTRAECDERGIVPALHTLHGVLQAVVGFDAFEHGCQGLHVPGDIDRVPEFLAPMRAEFESLLRSVGEGVALERGQ